MLSRFPIPSKENARLLLGFSMTYSARDLEIPAENVKIIGDVRQGTNIMTDGCGFISVLLVSLNFMC